MRINHKSDFDFRLDLYAADPYGTAVASGFPDSDFTGKLFIGPSARDRQCYTFSRSGKRLVNCYDNDGHLQIVVSGHNLHTGPLYCELTIKVANSNYPGGYRSVVHTFPLNIYLTDTDAEQISPTVSVTLPVIAVQDADNGTSGNTQADIIAPHLAQPWLAQRVCGGRFCTGAFVGNVYKNTGRIYLSGFNVQTDNDFYKVVRYDEILNLGIPGLKRENLFDNIHTTQSEHQKNITLVNDDCFHINSGAILDAYFIEIPGKHNFVTIDTDGRIKFLDRCSLVDYKPTKPTEEEIEEIITVDGDHIIFDTGVYHRLKFQTYENVRRVFCPKDNHLYRKPKYRRKKWTAINNRSFVTKAHNLFRVARHKHRTLSDWVYFRVSLINGGLKVHIVDESKI